MMKEDSVVLVTGGAGFLGQHVVKLLQTRANHVMEIRVLDICPFVQKLKYDGRTPVVHFVGSVTDVELVKKACRGVDCVIHLASYIDYSMFPDETYSYMINVEGTRNVIAACSSEGVSRLIYGSTIETVKSIDQEIFNGTEVSTSPPSANNFLFKAYGPSKRQAEDLVCRANCSTLKTLALRIVPMYGELEPRMAPVLTTSARTVGFYFSINCKAGRTSYSYVGNTAWAFLCADRSLEVEVSPELSPAGKVFYVGDDTPPTNVFDTLKPIAEEAGCKQFPVRLPLWIFLYSMHLLYVILWLIRFLRKINISTGIAAYYGMDKTYTFCYGAARRYLSYQPLFTYSHSVHLAADYYRELVGK